MPELVFTASEFSDFASSDKEANWRAIIHGYTFNGRPGMGVGTRDDGTTDYLIKIDQDDDKATIIVNMAIATLPTVLIVTASQTIIADGVDTKTFDLDGEPGKIVTLKWNGTEEIDKRSVTLDGFGNGSFVVGPYPVGRCTDADGFAVQCRYVDKSGDPVACTVIVGV